jgi:hypothetical protein
MIVVCIGRRRSPQEVVWHRGLCSRALAGAFRAALALKQVVQLTPQRSFSEQVAHHVLSQHTRHTRHTHAHMTHDTRRATHDTRHTTRDTHTHTAPRTRKQAGEEKYQLEEEANYSFAYRDLFFPHSTLLFLTRLLDSASGPLGLTPPSPILVFRSRQLYGAGS